MAHTRTSREPALHIANPRPLEDITALTRADRIWPLQEDGPCSNSRIAQATIDIELQSHDPSCVCYDCRGARLTIDQVFSGPTVVRDVRHTASLQKAGAQPGIRDRLRHCLAGKSLLAEYRDSCLSVCSQRHDFQQGLACRCRIVRAALLAAPHFAQQWIFSIKTLNLRSLVPSPEPHCAKPMRRTMQETSSKGSSTASVRAAVLQLIGKRTVFVATIGSRVVGTASLDGSVVRTVFVAPDVQARGIGKLLMAEIERTARERNIPSTHFS
jgi:acetyltransferase (GNAT) family protein